MIFKFGIDINGYMHIGHMHILLAIKKAINKKDKIIILLGDFTSKIGDPSGSNKKKINKTKKKYFVKKIIINIKKNINKIFTKNKNLFFVKNSYWFSKLNISEFLKISKILSFKKLFLRKEIKSRIKKKESLKTSEFLYPIFQIYDNIIIKPDYEFGGIDQRVNFLLSKLIQKKFKIKKTKYLHFNLLPGIFSNKKMSKSSDNCIFLKDKTETMFWKILRVKDEKILVYEKLFYKYSEFFDFSKIEKFLKTKIVNIFVKKKLKFFYFISKTLKRNKIFPKIEKYFNKKKNYCYYYFKNKINNLNMINFLVNKKLFKSRKEIKLLIQQKAVKVNKNLIFDKNFTFKKKIKYVIKIGKRIIIKINVR